MKKWFARLGIFFGIIFGLIVVTPFFIQVDRFRPQIEQAVNQKIQGQFQLGKLSLSLWGHLWVEVEGVKLFDLSKQEVLSVHHAYFEIPFSSVFSGSPQLVFKMDEPTIHLVRDKQGKFNVMALVVPSHSGTSASQSVAKPDQNQGIVPASTPKSSEAPLPPIVVKSRLGIELKNALLTYDDRKSDLKTEIKDFNLKLEDLSMSHPVRLAVWTDLSTRLGKTLSLLGPIRLEGKAQPEFQGQTFKSLTLDASLNADDLEVQMPGTFQKNKGIAAKTQIAMKVLPDEIQISEFKTTFLNAEVNAQGDVKGLESAAGPQFNLSFFTNEIQFKPWANLIPVLSLFDLGGAAQLNGHVKGTSTQPSYEASLVVKDLSAKAPMLKVQPRWNAKVHVKTDQIDSILLTMTAPGNQAELKGSVTSFVKPNVSLQLISDQMDLDQMIDLTSATSGTGSAEKGKASPAKDEKNQKAPEINYDAQIAELRKNPVLGNWVGQFSIRIGKFKAKQIQVSKIACQMGFKNWVTSFDQCGLKIFDGEIQSKMSANLGAAAPTYQGHLDVKGLDLTQAAEASGPMFKNTLRGRGDFRIDLQGASFNTETAKSNLKASGNLKVHPAEFSTLDIMKMVKEAVDQALVRVTAKVPQLKGKGIGALPSHKAEYVEISSDFSIQNALFSAPNFVAKAQTGQGFDLKGRTEVGIKSFSLNAFWELTDTYNLTQLRNISIEQNGMKAEHIFADGAAPVHFPLHVGCTLMAPCYSSMEIPEALSKVALTNIGKALSSQAKSELIKKAGQLLNNRGQGLPAGLQDKLRGLFR